MLTAGMLHRDEPVAHTRDCGPRSDVDDSTLATRLSSAVRATEALTEVQGLLGGLQRDTHRYIPELKTCGTGMGTLSIIALRAAFVAMDTDGNGSCVTWLLGAA